MKKVITETQVLIEFDNTTTVKEIEECFKEKIPENKQIIVTLNGCEKIEIISILRKKFSSLNVQFNLGGPWSFECLVEMTQPYNKFSFATHQQSLILLIDAKEMFYTFSIVNSLKTFTCLPSEINESIIKEVILTGEWTASRLAILRRRFPSSRSILNWHFKDLTLSTEYPLKKLNIFSDTLDYERELRNQFKGLFAWHKNNSRISMFINLTISGTFKSFTIIDKIHHIKKWAFLDIFNPVFIIENLTLQNLRSDHPEYGDYQFIKEATFVAKKDSYSGFWVKNIHVASNMTRDGWHALFYTINSWWEQGYYREKDEITITLNNDIEFSLSDYHSSYNYKKVFVTLLLNKKVRENITNKLLNAAQKKSLISFVCSYPMLEKELFTEILPSLYHQVLSTLIEEEEKCKDDLLNATQTEETIKFKEQLILLNNLFAANDINNDKLTNKLAIAEKEKLQKKFLLSQLKYQILQNYEVNSEKDAFKLLDLILNPSHDTLAIEWEKIDKKSEEGTELILIFDWVWLRFQSYFTFKDYNSFKDSEIIQSICNKISLKNAVCQTWCLYTLAHSFLVRVESSIPGDGAEEIAISLFKGISYNLFAPAEFIKEANDILLNREKMPGVQAITKPELNEQTETIIGKDEELKYKEKLLKQWEKKLTEKEKHLAERENKLQESLLKKNDNEEIAEKKNSVSFYN